MATGRVTIHALHTVRSITEAPDRRFIVHVGPIDTAGNLLAQKVFEAEQHAAPAVASTKHLYDRINAANGTGYRIDLFSGKIFANSSTYHPVGGCPLGKATDLFGRVKGNRKLYVTDSSLLPGNLAANPLLTVTALTERNIERVLAEDFA